ncbi:MAG: response regulator [Pseudomonadota bacterium]
MSRKILIIDDEEDIILYLTTLLGNSGFDVVATTNPLEAIDLAKKELPDLICLDIMMPRKSGMSIFKSLKSDEALEHIPVIIISGIGSAYGMKRPDFSKLVPGMEVDIEQFFEKPLDVDRFLAYLDGMFEGAGKGGHQCKS